MSRLKEALARDINGYSAIVILIVCLSMCAATLLLAFEENRRSERRICSLAESSIRAYEEVPPPTETGKRVARNWKEYRELIHCPPPR